MKSGDFSDSRDDEYYRKEFAALKERKFEQRVFSARPALVSKEPVNGHRMWKDYHGEPFDSNQFDLVEGMWDHDHCGICWFTIVNGFTYWESDGRIKLLCDACYEAFSRSKS